MKPISSIFSSKNQLNIVIKTWPKWEFPFWIKSFDTHFWRNVVGRSTKCFCSFLAINILLAHTEIGNFNVTILIQ